MSGGSEQSREKLADTARSARRHLTSPLVGGLIGVVSLVLAIAVLAFGNALAAGIVVGSVILVAGALLLYGRFFRDKVGGVLEVVQDVHEWEILEHSGQKATMTRTRSARVLQDEVFAIRDIAQGSKGSHVNPRCDQWPVVHEYRNLDQTIAIIALEDVKNRDESLDYSVTWDVEGVLVDPKNWVESTIHYETMRMTMRVLFPATRAPLKAHVVKRNSSEKPVELVVRRHGSEMFKIEHHLWYPRRHNTYRIAWEWGPDTHPAPPLTSAS